MKPKQPRIPAVPDNELAPADVVQAIRKRRGGGLLNLDRMLLNSPPYAVGWNAFMAAVRTGLSLDPKLRELAICAVAVINRADYELVQHAPELRATGATQTQVERLQDIDAAALDATLFDGAERAVLALTIEMTRKVQVSDACFAQLRLALPKVQDQVELAGVIAAYNMVSRFLEALQVPPEPV